MSTSARISRAVISVFDKDGVVKLAEFLHRTGVEILSTGGTSKVLRAAGLPIIEISDYTGFPECFGGRLKTLHPRVLGGIVYRRNVPEDVERANELGIKPIDLVVVNLYPFKEVISRTGTTFEDAIENIDIGGPNMLRAAAKNHDSVTVASHPSQYAAIQREMAADGSTSSELRYRLANNVFKATADYDKCIEGYLDEHGWL